MKLVVLLALAAIGCASRTENLEPIRETVVYSTIQPANWDLYLFDRAGSAPRRLTTDPRLD